jgi:small subunit ribosomal protein S16
MPVVIRLMRAGAKKRPFYRMVAADSRRQRDGRFLEILGHYNPLSQPYELVVHKDKVETWISKGAQPSEQVASLLRSLGIAMSRPSKPQKAEAAAGADTATAGKKKAVRRAVPRKLSARKVEKRTRKAAAKKSGAATAAKQATP